MSKPYVDPEAEEVGDNELEFSSLDSIEEPEEPGQPEETEEEKEERLLAGKFKSTEELEKAYQNIEKEKSRQGNELGELRSKVDQLIGAQQANQQTPQQEESKEEDFWDNPEKYIQQKVQEQTNPKVEQIEQQLTQQNAEKAKQQLLSRHEDAFDIYQDSGFQEWIQARPAYQKVMQEADQNYDAETAADMLDIYKKETGVENKAPAEEKSSHDSESLKGASVESSKSQKSSSKKIYRRADIVDLMMNNPERYEQLADEINAAYAEGRVK